jgi:hypothetical protein
MRIRPHTGLLAALILSVGGLTALAMSVSAGAASGQVCMGVVIEDGSGAAPSVQAANVDPGASDLDAMSAAGDTFTQNDSGLVCGINNYPANALSNCLNAKKGQFYYWSYWQGDPDTNTWTYANVGPASHDASAGTDYVEGWRYQDPGPDNPTAPPPTVTPAAAFAQACTSTTTTTTSGGGGGSSGGGSGSGAPAPSTGSTTPPTIQLTIPQASGSAAPHTADRGNAVTTTTSPKGAGGTPPSTVVCTTTTTTTTTTPHTAGRTTTTTTTTTPHTAGRGNAVTTTTMPKRAAGTPPSTVVCATTTTSVPVVVGSHQKSGTSPTRLADADASSHGQGGGDPLLPIVLAAVVIGLLGGVAWLRWRRRPAEE